eukprot:11708036-Alexandrium_andersonii.AAC.1
MDAPSSSGDPPVLKRPAQADPIDGKGKGKGKGKDKKPKLSEETIAQKAVQGLLTTMTKHIVKLGIAQKSYDSKPLMAASSK